MMPVMSAGEVGTMAAEALQHVATRALGTTPIVEYVSGAPVPWSVIADGGWDSIGVAEADGGGGAGLVDLVYAARAWGQSCIPLPFVVSTMTKRWCPAAREHTDPVTIAVPRVRGAQNRARAPFAAEPGVLVARSLGGDNTAPEIVADATVDNFAPSLRLAAVPWSSPVAPAAATELGVVWAAEATGSAQKLLELSVDYAKDRRQFGKQIGSFQAVKHRLADMRMQTEAAETAVLWAALQPEDAERAARFALDTAVEVAESAVQVHGGMGFTWELGIHFYLRHVLTLRELVHGLWR